MRHFEYYGKGGFDQAIADYGQAIELAPTYAEAYCHRAEACLSLGEWELAIQDYEKYLELRPNAPDREDVINTIQEIKSELVF